MRRTKRAALLRPVVQPTTRSLTCRAWLPVLSAALFTVVGNTPRSARADGNGSQTHPPRFTQSDLNVPSLAEEDDTFILPLTPALTVAGYRTYPSEWPSATRGPAPGAAPIPLPPDANAMVKLRRDVLAMDFPSPVVGGGVGVGASSEQNPAPLGKVQVTQSFKTTYELDGQSFHAVGNPENPDPKMRDVVVIYTDPRTNKPIILRAQKVDFDGRTRKITALGYGRVLPGGSLEHPITLTREDGIFTGNRIEYDFDDREGVVEQARVESDYFRLSGEKIQANKDGSFSVTKGHFTTCNRSKPDYEITAGSLIVFPQRYVSARNITLYLGGVKLIPIPSYRRNLRVRSQVAGLVKPGYSRRDGITLHRADTPLLETHTTFDYDLSVNFRRLPTGFLLYQHDLSPTPEDALPPRGVLPTLGDPLRGVLETISPPTYQDYAESLTLEPYPRRFTLFATLQHEQYVYNRRRNDLSISRYPEIGFRYANIFGKLPPPPTPAVPVQTSLLQRVPNAPFLMDIYGAVGVLRELPTNLTTGRLSTRINLATQPRSIGKRLTIRAGVSDWFNLYTQGSAYNIISPEAEVDYIPTSTSVFNIGYRYLDDAGTTPFASDQRDIRHELRFQYQVGGPVSFGVVGKYDIERSRAYDAEVAILRNLDCMQFGVAYRFRSQQFNIIFNLLPPGHNRGH